METDLGKANGLPDLDARWKRIDTRITQARGRGDIDDAQMDELRTLYMKAKANLGGDQQEI